MSSESESDEEYVPGKPEQVSEEESADEETETQYEGEVAVKNKRKSIAKQTNVKKRKPDEKTKRVASDSKTEKNEQDEEQLDPEEQKKKEDDLWASFLEGTPKPKSATTEPAFKKVQMPVKSEKRQCVDKKEDINSREARIFEFAGEKVVVENNVIKEVVKCTPSSPAAASNLPTVAKSCGSGGLASVLGQLNKKNKLSMLEKTKLDWNTFKMKEGIEEEIQTFNRGKDGYLEKQDFLERADVRQFEIEKDLRLSRRSNR